MASVSVGMASFARFYEATHSARVRIARDIRSRYTDPKGYAGRNYYGDFFNTVRAHHWRDGDLDVLSSALDDLIADQKDTAKREHFEVLSTAYVSGWTSRFAEWFPVARSEIEIEDVRITITPELGMKALDDEYVLKWWLNSPKPTRQYRQAIEYMMSVGRGKTWKPNWKARIWDVRRDQLLVPMKLPRDFALGFEAQVVAFKQIWAALEQEVEDLDD